MNIMIVKITNVALIIKLFNKFAEEKLKKFKLKFYLTIITK